MPFYLFLLSNFFFWLGDNLLLLGEDHLDVAGGAHVGVDPPVSSVGAPAHFGSLVHLDVLNHQRIHIETLGGDKIKTLCLTSPCNNATISAAYKQE